VDVVVRSASVCTVRGAMFVLCVFVRSVCLSHLTTLITTFEQLMFYSVVSCDGATTPPPTDRTHIILIRNKRSSIRLLTHACSTGGCLVMARRRRRPPSART
jgi:hypothetical protein